MGLYDQGKGLLISLPEHEGLKEPSTGLFKDAASYLIILTHSCFEEIAYLPFPVGTIIRKAEEAADPWTGPIVQALEGISLGILDAIDNEIDAVGASVEGCILCSADRVKSVLIALRKRGLIGASADLWVRYEASLRGNLQKAIDLANKVPLISIITPVVCAIAAPLARAVSDWLVKHSEVVEKGIQLPSEAAWQQNDSAALKVEHEWIDDMKGGQEDDKRRANAESDVTKETEAIDVPGPVTLSTAEERLELEDVIEEIKEEEQINTIEDSILEENDVNDVLEMIESSWLLGSVAMSPLPSPKQASFSRSRKGTPIN